MISSRLELTDAIILVWVDELNGLVATIVYTYEKNSSHMPCCDYRFFNFQFFGNKTSVLMCFVVISQALFNFEFCGNKTSFCPFLPGFANRNCFSVLCRSKSAMR